MFNVVDIIAPGAALIDQVNIHIIDEGKSNFVEFNTETLRTIHLWEFAVPDFDTHRGVYGYVAFGYGTIQSPIWLEGRFVNWTHSSFIPPFAVGVNLARIWMRKGVRANFYVEKHDPLSVSGAIIKPALP